MSRKKHYSKIVEINLVPYDCSWAASFQVEQTKIRSVLSNHAIAIHHVGSTAVPHICAKPIVDILVVIDDIHCVNKYNFQMIRMGYEARGEYGITRRRYFTKTENRIRTHNIHIFQSDHPDSTWLIAFRDHLLENKADAVAYDKVKRNSASKYKFDIDLYVSEKRQFIESIRSKILRTG